MPAPPSKCSQDLPYVDRHKPRHLGQVVGNTEQVRKLAEWLRDWDDVVLRGNLKKPPEEKEEDKWRKFKPLPENLNARAALISGPPGIGKTTTCVLLAKCSPKYSVMEFNASDARGKLVIEQMSQSLAGNHTLRLGDGVGGGPSLQRSVMIMDECDGMSGGGDKGGMTAMINMIKATKNPIICICNDRGTQEVRNLSTHCLDIKFRRPEVAIVAKRVKTILEGEGKKVDPNALAPIIEGCGHDIRQVLNQVQFFGTVTSSTGKDTQVMVSPFDAGLKLLCRDELKPLPMERRLDLFYIDSDFMPMMIQENYLRTYEKSQRNVDDPVELAKAATAAECIALADAMSGNWELQGSAAVIGSIYPAFLTADANFTRVTFPAVLQKIAPMNKARRMIQEMHSRIRPHTSCSRRNLATSAYHDLLHRRILTPLVANNAKKGAEMLCAYGLNREFFTDQAPCLRAPLGMDDGYKRLEGKTKYQLLQELQERQQIAAPVKRKRVQDGTATAGDAVDEVDDGGAAGAEGDEDDGGAGGLVKKRKASAKKPSTKGTVSKPMSMEEQMAKCTLNSWVPKSEMTQAGGESQTKTAMLFKFIDGHTCSVRRKVHLTDLLGPWRQF